MRAIADQLRDLPTRLNQWQDQRARPAWRCTLQSRKVTIDGATYEVNK